MKLKKTIVLLSILLLMMTTAASATQFGVFYKDSDDAKVKLYSTWDSSNALEGLSKFSAPDSTVELDRSADLSDALGAAYSSVPAIYMHTTMDDGIALDDSTTTDEVWLYTYPKEGLGTPVPAGDAQALPAKVKVMRTALDQMRDMDCGEEDTLDDIEDHLDALSGQPAEEQAIEESLPEETSEEAGMVAKKVVSGAQDCILTTNNEAYCWRGAAEEPSKIELEGVTDIVAGFDHYCALTSENEMYCWGKNYHGQLGDGTAYYNEGTSLQYKGLTLARMSNPTKMAAGHGHTCAVNATGMYCWGNNDYSTLGTGYSLGPLSTLPVRNNLEGVQMLDGGIHTTCATNAEGMYCWGYNAKGNLGDGTTDHRALPTKTQLTNAAVQFSVGGQGACAIDTSGDLYCWGDNTYGQLPNGQSTPYYARSPYKISFEGAQKVAYGWQHVCAVNAEKEVWCWGKNGAGQLGNGETSDGATREPVKALLSAPAVEVSAGNGGSSLQGHSCALTETGAVYCWGSGYGSTPVKVLGPEDTAKEPSAEEIEDSSDGSEEEPSETAPAARPQPRRNTGFFGGIYRRVFSFSGRAVSLMTGSATKSITTNAVNGQKLSFCTAKIGVIKNQATQIQKMPGVSAEELEHASAILDDADSIVKSLVVEPTPSRPTFFARWFRR